MKILSHRGYWKVNSEQNTITAFENSLKANWGFESDVRDSQGSLVISHDIVKGYAMPVESVTDLLKRYNDAYCFAINIKADGLAPLLKVLLSKYHIDNYFVFDMSATQMLSYCDCGLRCYTRQSEHELLPYLYESAAGVWMDAIEDDSWITEKLVWEHLSCNKKVALVSPELHQRDECIFWQRLKKMHITESNDVFLCTDHPYVAEKFFEG